MEMTLLFSTKKRIMQDSGFICNLREINKKLVRKPYSLPKVQDLPRKIGKFKYATTLDLVMGFNNITMDEEAQRICTLILPWGKYLLIGLKMGSGSNPNPGQNFVLLINCTEINMI
jgi:hypothetical protein